MPGVAAEECTQTSSPIETDRPDTTNSSLVVPVGSFQNENGVNISSRGGTRMFDGTNTRLRLGIAPCMEVLVDVPTYMAPIGGSGASGFTDVAPAVKWQISPVPGKFDLSVTAGNGVAYRGDCNCRPWPAALPAIPVVGGDWGRLGRHRHGHQFLHAGGAG
jgi:hypothetical protein